MSCEGCKLEIIRNKSQETIVHENAKDYANQNNVPTVVYFTGQSWQFATETFAREQGIVNITGLYFPEGNT